MKRLAIFTLLFALILAGCNVPTAPVVFTQPAAESTQPAAANTQPAAADTQPAVDAQPSATPQAGDAQATPAQPQVTQPAAQPQSEPGGRWVAYVGMDGNIWLADPLTGEQRQVTSEGAGLNPPGGQQAVIYSSPAWSSDGQLLAYTRQLQTPLPDRMDYEMSLWVYDLASGQSRTIFEKTDLFGLFSWQPGRHVLAYNQGLDPNYWTGRGVVDSSLARGIRTIDVDTGATAELVPPSRGYHLVNPQWSPDGSRICFNEVLYMEGLGPFACYEFASGQYQAWERSIGGVDFSPDGQKIAYDFLTYAPSGEERITLNNPQGTAEQPFAPVIEGGYSSQAVFSPRGDQIAYAGYYATGSASKLFVQGLTESYPRELGVFESPSWLSWSPDGTHLLLSVGPYDRSQVIVVEVASGAVKPVGEGISPTWQP